MISPRAGWQRLANKMIVIRTAERSIVK